MLTQELCVEIYVLHKQGKSVRAISKMLCVSRNTVRRYLREKNSVPTYKTRPSRASKLAPFVDYLQERIKAAEPDWIPATVLFREIQAQGYAGKDGILRDYLRPFKVSKIDPVVRFETPAGKQLQVDFTTIRKGRRKLKAFVATLGFSRATYVRFSEHERQEDWLAGIEGAFVYFGGVPLELLFDNAKCIMIERDAYGEGQHRWNASLLELSKDYGFKLKACRPYRAKTKGKVERFNGYLKGSFIIPLVASLKQAGLEIEVDIANAQIGPWLQDIAHQRIHATTGEKPQVLLDKERVSLMPLPNGVIRHPLCGVEKIQQRIIPAESIQHPLSMYDDLLEIRA